MLDGVCLSYASAEAKALRCVLTVESRHLKKQA